MASNLLVTGGHAHDFAATSAAVAALLAPVGIGTTITDDVDGALAGLADAPVDLLTVQAVRFRMLPERYDDLRPTYRLFLSDAAREGVVTHLARGGGLLGLHTASICFDDWPQWADILGAGWDWGRSWHPTPRRSHIGVRTGGHPIVAGVGDFDVLDEIYVDLAVAPDVVPLAESDVDGRPQPVLWARSWHGARIVYDALGHGVESLAESTHATLVVRAALWASGADDGVVAAAVAPALSR
jgi:hypothetical protein